MTWQAEVGSGIDRAIDYRDFLVKLVALMTSQHAATVVINDGGTGYAVGETLTLTHAGAMLDARFEVLTHTGGVIDTLQIVSSGAFAIRVATVAVGASGGTGYAVDDVVEIQGGTSREKAKAKVTTVAGGVVTGIALFESGGAYSVAPGLTDAVTVGIGPNGFAGDDALVVDITVTTLVGTTALATTGGGNGDATVDITLAQTGWAIDSRNVNSRVGFGGITDEKEVTLVGDATGRTNKPYLHFISLSSLDGLDDTYAIFFASSIAHNPATTIGLQVGVSPGINTSDVLLVDGPFLLFPINFENEADFWISADDRRICGVVNCNPDTAGDDGAYLSFYSGYIDSGATEVEDPYPFFVHAAARQAGGINPKTSSEHITSMCELICDTGDNPAAYFYRSEDSTWQVVENSEGPNADQDRVTIMFPMGQIFQIITPSNSSDRIAHDGPVPFWTGIGSTARAASSRRLLPVPGTVASHLPIPLTIIHRPGQGVINLTLDTIRGQLAGCFWVYNSDDAALTINDFSEDFITIGSDRYRVFHTAVQTQNYHFFAIKEDV